MTAVNEEGEIIYDSIIKNKEKTKKYWEQLMMAAATAKQQKVQYHSSDNIRCHLQVESDGEDGKPQSDISEQEYFDAQSHISTLSPETFDSLEHSQDEENPRSPAPKIVETVAKKLLRKEELNCLPVPVETIIKTVESVIEREIRLQKEREEALCRERELALRKAETNPVSPNQPNLISPLSPSAVPLSPRKSVILNDNSFEEKRNALNETLDLSPSAEVKIALELREMKEREEELRRLRQNLSSKNEDKIVAVDDGFVSIPNTDEGNYSEYGSEEKELSLDGSFSRASPEVPVQGMFPHQRTQSMDSVSSGHSSSYGGNNEYYSTRRRVVMVKPFEDPYDDEIPAYMRKQKETPIEREIRLAREREEELRREKGLPPISGSVFSTPTSARTERSNVRSTMTTKDPRSVQHRLATSRIQQEIDEATEREKELRAAGKIQTMSEDTVDSKVTRFSQLGEYSMEKEELRLQRSTSVSNIPLSEQVMPDSSPSHPKLHANSSLPSLQNNGRSPQAKNTIRQLFPGKGQRGLMQRFIASRGKLNIISVPNTLPIVQNSVSPFSSPDHQQTSSPVQKSTEVSNQENHTTISDEVIDDVDSVSRLTVRPGYTSAEKKIEVELREMQKREEELRLQRAQMFGYSHPNLLSIDDNEDEKDIENGEDINETEDEIENLHTLRTTRSIPFNLNFDDSSYVNGEVLKNKPLIGSRKKSALIEEWENKIQQNNEN